MVQEHASVHNAPVPEEFSVYIKQILENFYNFPYLNNHPLAKALQNTRLRPSESDGQRLRRVFLNVIEEQKPGSEAAQKTLQARYYNLINLRYIESATMQFVAHELGISERQAYRDLKRAEESLTALLWENMDILTDDLFSSDTIPDKNEFIVESLDLQFRQVNAHDLISYAAHAVERLALQQGIRLDIQLSANAIELNTDPALAQQVLINLFSQVLQNVPTPYLQVRLDELDDQPAIILGIQSENPQDSIHFDNPVTNQFIHQLGWRFVPSISLDSHIQEIKIILRGQETTILVIDDHPPLIELLRRYLTQTRCKVVGVSDGQKGIAMARSLLPDLILLDVMMPEIDGWEVLQRLRNTPETVHIPVVICSIFNDPKLAYSLGATALLTKPVNREKLIDLLKSMKILGE